MKGYRTEKTTMGHKLRIRMSREEIRERRRFRALIVVWPFAMCWLLAWAARMI